MELAAAHQRVDGRSVLGRFTVGTIRLEHDGEQALGQLSWCLPGRGCLASRLRDCLPIARTELDSKIAEAIARN